MRKATRILRVLLIIAIALAILAFVLENQQSIALSLLGLSTAQLPVSIFVVLALIAGMLIGPLLFALLGRRNHRRKQSVADAQ